MSSGSDGMAAGSTSRSSEKRTRDETRVVRLERGPDCALLRAKDMLDEYVRDGETRENYKGCALRPGYLKDEKRMTVRQSDTGCTTIP